MKYSFACLALLFSTSSFANAVIDCTYTQVSDRDGLTPTELQLKFELNPDGPRGFVIDDKGTRQVQLVYKGNGASFIDESSTGEVFLTTVDRQLNSTHSRHQVSLQGSLFPQQYYGKCKANKPW
ncbi:hypothetical protein [Motilimonas pumila]|uniref:Adhesin n=1 Tax=Motilimonas pumila TaxID=2303987 RepID=A0A418YC99_9GAMM|nr:hypothetical protein [Motilimonas pumila]RJG42114.1 hypothetical protein D1Z90_15120 [Motilimonas pumila]